MPQFALLDSPPVLMTNEPDESRPDEWRLDAYFETRPTKSDLNLIASLVPSAKGVAPSVESLPDQDWVTMSQQGLEPIRAGRFFVYTPAHRGDAPEGATAFEIDAGRAFGTGHHQTTAGCLTILDRLKSEGQAFRNIVDVGTGTGLLAFAANRLWPSARIAASDIDPVSIDVTRGNAALNRIRTGRGPGQVELIVAPGLAHMRLRARAPYDLIIANILAGPLIDLAPAIAAALAPGGRLVLAGLLDTQAIKVADAYRKQKLMLTSFLQLGDWPTLLLRKRRTQERVRPTRSRPAAMPTGGSSALGTWFD